MTIGFDASRAFISDRTGTENYSYQLLKSLAKIDHVNQYLVYIRPLGSWGVRTLGKNSQKPNYLTTQLPNNFKIIEISWKRFWTQAGLVLKLFRDTPDLLFIPAHTLPILRPAKLKTVVTVHDLGYEYLPQYHSYPNKLYLSASTKWAVAWADRIIAVSKLTKSDLVKKLNVNPSKIDVVYEGIDLQKFKIKSEELKIEEILAKYKIQQPYVLFVGTIQPRKNLERLIEAFSIVTNNSKLKTKNLQLVIAGKPGWLYKEIYQAPKKFKIDKKVKFLNYVRDDDLPNLYNAAKVFVLPSLAEGFGLPVVEAMACGCPVVASNSTSLPEIVADAGILVDPYNVKKLADKINLIIENNNLAQKLGNLGLARAKDFSWDKTAYETLKVFEKTIKNSK